MSSFEDFQADPNAVNQRMIAEFRANGGKLGGRLANSRLLLLTTTGARSGRPRTVPLGYTVAGDRLVVIAANAGAPKHPDWFHNLVANPQVTVEVGAEQFRARASVPVGAERERLLEQQLPQMPYFADQQRKTTRQIPLVVLERAD
jgi:deazaflavin-dependent oxidoreductase (nitroreductase family)